MSVATTVHIEVESWSADFVRALMADCPSVRPIGSATTGREGLELCRELRPRVVLVDLDLPDMDGFAVAEELAALRPTPAVLLLTTRSDEYTLYRLRRTPVRSLLCKNGTMKTQLRTALAEVLAGRSYFPPEVLAIEAALRRDPRAIGKILAPKDIALLARLGRGDSDRQIAEQTGSNVLTVKWRRCCIMRKLDLHNRVELMHWARHKGFVD